MEYNIYLLITFAALATYATRVGGHLVLSRFGRINHRVEAALDAVPTAVLTALVAPSLVNQTLAETIAILAAGALSLRFSPAVSVAGGMLIVVLLRQVF
ncbi:MAG: AzlD domain-containing protein [Pseudomonadota bacterium]